MHGSSTSHPLSTAPSRRALLQGASVAAGAFVLGCFVPFGDRALAAGAPTQGIFDPNVFIRIAPDNTVTLICKHFEMGQGVTTGLATLVAEELEAPWADMRFAFAPSNPALYKNLIFGVMGTGATTSIANSWVQMRQVGAAARTMLVAAAAARWNVPAREISVENGVVMHGRSGRRARFGELAAEAMQMPVPKEVTLKRPSDWKLIGQRLPRLDSVSKTTGRAVFSSDIRRPGMLVAVVKRPDLFGATVRSFDDREAKAIQGVVDIIQAPSGVAVLAKDTWTALRGRDALSVDWDTSNAETRSTDDILTEYRTLADTKGLVAVHRGDADAGLSRASTVYDAEFTFPFLAHAPMEPLNCVIEVGSDGAELWSGCQLQTIDQSAIARVLGLKPEQIKINTLLGGGSFGRRGNPVADWTKEIAHVAKAFGKRAPIQLVWTREDDIKGGFYRPLVLHRVKVGLDASGRIMGWRHKIVCQSLFIGTPLESSLVHNGVDEGSVEGVINTPYDIGDFEVESFNARSPVPVLWWRSVGHSHGAHVMETVIDELARLARQDPVAFRLALLAQKPRDAAVIRLAADRTGWGQPTPAGRGRGFAYHSSYNTRVAMVAEVSVVGSAIKVERIVAAVDCGVAINPDIVKAQIEGAVGFALSACLRNQITLSNGRVQQSNFDDYEPTHISEMPQVDVHIVASQADPSGIGEPGVPPLAPAIGNAIFAATGKRLRSLPFDAKALG
ncbi:MAG: xanthine dehydrogenase family protein molybdopterin-binding subunit [Rhodoplanes sp.]